MATINPVVTRTNVGFGTRVDVLWSAGTDVDTLTPHVWQGGKDFASLQFYGTIGAATMTFEVSNDAAVYYDPLDVDAAAITGTAAYMRKIRQSGKQCRPGIAGGTAESINIALTYFV